jgi:DNA polymerase-3 subunit delta'
MFFSEVAGQKNAKNSLIQYVSSGKIPHALLLLGKEGTGGLPLALAFIQYIYCESKSTTDSCGVCPSCIKIQKLAHPDLHLSFPTIAGKTSGAKASSKLFLNEFRNFVKTSVYGTTYDWLQSIDAENKQGNITAEECRAIIEELNLSAFEGGYKVQLIWRPEYLGKEGNILLKLMEEPPKNTLIIMVAEETEMVLPTILSRTQQVILLPLTVLEIEHTLVMQRGLDQRKANQVALMAEGSYTEALQLLQYASNDLLEPLREWFNAVFTNNGIKISNWVDSMSKLGREQQKNFLRFTQQILGHALRATYISQYTIPLSEEESVFVQKLAQRQFSASVFQRIDDLLSKTSYHIERNAHAKTQLLSLSIQMQYAIQDKQLEAL